MIKHNIISILTSLIILYLSLANSDTFDQMPLINIPNFDKIVHFGMYFTLMSAILFENRKVLKTNKYILLSSLIPVSYGILMEILQGTITTTRSASIYDILFNTAGSLTSCLIFIWITTRKEKDLNKN
jgi:VanZ family protein